MAKASASSMKICDQRLCKRLGDCFHVIGLGAEMWAFPFRSRFRCLCPGTWLPTHVHQQWELLHLQVSSWICVKHGSKDLLTYEASSFQLDIGAALKDGLKSSCIVLVLHIKVVITNFSLALKYFDHVSEMWECLFPGSNACGQGHDCQQMCINNGDSYNCKCQDGYVLNADQKTCSRKDGGFIFFFLFSNIHNAVCVLRLFKRFSKCVISSSHRFNVLPNPLILLHCELCSTTSGVLGLTGTNLPKGVDMGWRPQRNCVQPSFDSKPGPPWMLFPYKSLYRRRAGPCAWLDERHSQAIILNYARFKVRVRCFPIAICYNNYINIFHPDVALLGLWAWHISPCKVVLEFTLTSTVILATWKVQKPRVNKGDTIDEICDVDILARFNIQLGWGDNTTLLGLGKINLQTA